MQFADSVFIGRVVALSDLHRAATMEVLEIWKGPDLSERVEVQGASSSSAVVGPNDRLYVLGGTYLVVPFGRASPFYDDACSGTILYAPRGGQIPAEYRDAVGAENPRIPAAAESSPRPVPSGAVDGSVLLLGGGAVLLAALAIWFLGRRKKTRGVSPGPEPIFAVPEVHPAPREQNPPDSSLAPSPGKSTSSDRPQKRRSPRHAKGNRARSNGARSGAGAKGPPRFGRSGLSNLESVRRKTRRFKAKQRKAR